jgi:uncharacterized protein
MSDLKLIGAVREGNLDALSQFLTDGSATDERDEQGWTPLHWAAGKGETEAVRLLLEHGADLFATGRDQRTPLLVAKAAQRHEVAEILTAAAEARGSGEEDPAATRPYARAYLLCDLRAFPHWPAFSDAAIEEEGSVVYVHQDFAVTRSMWRHQDVIFDQVTPEWVEFCRERLRFVVPAELR